MLLIVPSMICSWKPERLTDGERHGIGKAWEELISKPPSNVPTYLSANTLDHDAHEPDGFKDLVGSNSVATA